MNKKVVSETMLALLIISMLTLTFNTQITTQASSASVWLNDKSTKSITHEGDLVIDGNETFIIENCTYIQTGNVYVRDNARLIIKNAELQLNQTSHWQYSLEVSDNGILETRNVTIRNHLLTSYRFGVYFYGNSTPLIVDSTIKKYMFCKFPLSIHIQGNVYVHNSKIERIDVNWVHNAFINHSTIGSLQFIRGGTLNIRPMIYLISSNITMLYFNDFGGTLYIEKTNIGDLRLEGVGLKIIRNFDIISLDNTGNSLGNVNLKLYNHSNILLWSGSTNVLGNTNFNITFTPANYSATLMLEATKGASTYTTNITLLSETPIIVTLTPIIGATVDLRPDALNLKSRGGWVICHIELPKGYNVEDINVPTILLNDVVSARSSKVISGKLRVSFDRSEVIPLLSHAGEVELTITGKLFDGTMFEGSDTIRVR